MLPVVTVNVPTFVHEVATACITFREKSAILVGVRVTLAQASS